jgi:uncharacterized RDD family membrane protein YckC
MPGQDLPQAPPVPTEYGYGQYGGQPVPAGMYYDQQSELILPNGTELASVGRRIGAYFLAIGLAIVTLGIGYIIWGLILWPTGRSPALSVLGCRVWRPDDKQPASFGWMALRDIVGRFIEGLIFIWVVSFILMCTGKQRKTVHDMIAGTIVLHDPNKVIPTS